MPLDTSSYSLALLRLDGRRWNELRRITGQISTQAAADGSSYLEMGNTKIICTVTGPEEGRRAGTSGAAGGTSTGVTAAAPVGASPDAATVQVEINFAAFGGVERKRRARNDKRTAEMACAVANAFAAVLFTGLYPHSAILVSLHVLSQDGSLLAACLNAATLALVDAGVPMVDYIAACTVGSTTASGAGAGAPGAEAEVEDPLLDLNGLEEQEVPFLTVGTLGAGDKVSVLVLETRVRVERVEPMLATGVDGCRHVRRLLDDVVRRHGKRVLGMAAKAR